LENLEHERREKYYWWIVENPELANLKVPKKVAKSIENAVDGSQRSERTKKEETCRDRRKGNTPSRESEKKVRLKEKKKSVSTKKKIVKWIARKLAEEIVEVGTRKLQEMEDHNRHDGHR